MIDEKQNLSVQVDIQWNDELVNYKDRYFVLKTNFWRDSYPEKLDYKIKRAELNQTLTIDYEPGALLQSDVIPSAHKVFQEAARILKPGGVFFVSFSERFYEKKVITLWDDVHLFERMGIVLEYFRQSGEFEALHSESIRGLIRHEDDPFINTSVHSCPIYMTFGQRKA